jgi:putative membrane protein
MLTKQRMIKNTVAWVFAALLMAHNPVWAQEATAAARSRPSLVEGIVGTLIFGAIGIVLAIVGFKLFDVVVRHNIEQEIFEKNNMAAALLAGAIVLGVSIIVAATILS